MKWPREQSIRMFRHAAAEVAEQREINATMV
jgi:hypothetical protein